MGQQTVAHLVKAIADAEGTEPTDLGFSLQDHIPVDAIEQLATHDTASWTLSFELPDHEVTVSCDGSILINGERKQVRV